MSNELFSLSIEGIDEIINALNNLDVEITSKLLKAFNRKAVTKFIVNPIKQAIPYSSKVKAGIKTLTDSSNPNKVYGGATSNVYWVRFADGGTKSRKTKKGFNRGAIVGKNRIRPVIDNAVEPIISYTQKELGSEIEKLIIRRVKTINKKKKS